MLATKIWICLFTPTCCECSENPLTLFHTHIIAQCLAEGQSQMCIYECVVCVYASSAQRSTWEQGRGRDTASSSHTVSTKLRQPGWLFKPAQAICFRASCKRQHTMGHSQGLNWAQRSGTFNSKEKNIQSDDTHTSWAQVPLYESVIPSRMFFHMISQVQPSVIWTNPVQIASMELFLCSFLLINPLDQSARSAKRFKKQKHTCGHINSLSLSSETSPIILNWNGP